MRRLIALMMPLVLIACGDGYDDAVNRYNMATAVGDQPGQCRAARAALDAASDGDSTSVRDRTRYVEADLRRMEACDL